MLLTFPGDTRGLRPRDGPETWPHPQEDTAQLGRTRDDLAGPLLASDAPSSGLAALANSSPPFLPPTRTLWVRTHLPELFKILLHVLHRGVDRETPYKDLLGSSHHLFQGGNEKVGI